VSQPGQKKGRDSPLRKEGKKATTTEEEGRRAFLKRGKEKTLHQGEATSFI